jgi:predicted acylesterase/phospholipase RssA
MPLFMVIPEPVRVFFQEWIWWTLIHGFSVPLALPAVLFFLVLVLFFRLGIGLGLPRLFWQPEPGAQFMVGIGVGAVVWQIFLAGYVFEEFATNFTVDRPPFCEVRVPPIPTSAPVTSPGFNHRFRYEPSSVISIWRYTGAVAAALLFLAVSLAILVLLMQAIGQFVRSQISGWRPHVKSHPQPRIGYGPWLPLGSVAGWLLMTGLTAVLLVLPAGVAAKPIGGGLLEMAEWGKSAERRYLVTDETPQGSSNRGNDSTQQKNDKSDAENKAKEAAAAREKVEKWYGPYYPVYAAFVIDFVVIAVVSLVFILLPPRLRWFSPAVGIVLILNIVVFGTICLTVFPPFKISGNLFLLCLLVLVVLAGRSYKFRFPNMPASTVPVSLEDRYKALVSAEAKITDGATDELVAAETYSIAEPGETVRPVLSHTVPYPHPDVWSGGKPPLAIISLSGGGSRAAAWAMQVLVALEERFLKPGGGRPPMLLPYHTRLITGASGGMLAGAYYAASLAAPRKGGAVNRNTVKRANGDYTPITPFDLLDGVRQDLLTPITHTLVNHDLPALFCPTKFAYDRGQAFEEAIQSLMHGQLHVPMTSLRDGEALGWRPSLIFSPMLVEDGRQLFISNLDLRRVTQNRAFILGEIDKESPTDPDGFGLLSREGIEFYKLFPNATDFTVATAVRMSASFPYVLPAVPLPTDPPRRVVDAGYYDNFGIGIASSWLFNHMEWIRQNTSGVVVIQIRDGMSEAGRKREEVTDSFPPLLERGLQWLTSPPEGLWEARTASNTFRNDNLLHLLNDFFMARGFPRGFFSTVAFEFSGGDDVALNFTLASDEIKEVQTAVDNELFARRADALLNWWHMRMRSPNAPLTLQEVEQ